MSTAARKSKRDKKAGSAPNAAAKLKKKTPARGHSPAKYQGEKLSPARQKALVRSERTITKSLAGFVKVGCALKVISDEKLYKASHSKFGEYCKARWKLSSKHAYRLMAAAEIVEQLRAGKGRVSSESLPKRESQVRSLALLCGTQCSPVAVWKQAVKEAGGKAPSAALVSKLVRECLGKSGLRASRRRGGSGVLSPNGKIAKIQKLLAKTGSEAAGQSKKFYEQTLVKIRKLVGEPKS